MTFYYFYKLARALCNILKYHIDAVTNISMYVELWKFVFLLSHAFTALTIFLNFFIFVFYKLNIRKC